MGRVATAFTAAPAGTAGRERVAGFARYACVTKEP